MSTTKKSTVSMVKTRTNMTSPKTIKKNLQKNLVSKIQKSWSWPGHVKDVLEKNVLYRIVSATIAKYKYAYVTLVSVKSVLGEGKTLETYFTALQTKRFRDYFNSENIDIKHCPELLCDLVFCYTGELKAQTGNFYSGFKFEQSDEDEGLAEHEL